MTIETLVDNKTIYPTFVVPLGRMEVQDILFVLLMISFLILFRKMYLNFIGNLLIGYVENMDAMI